MKLLAKTRKLNNLLQTAESLDFSEVSQVLGELINAKVEVTENVNDALNREDASTVVPIYGKGKRLGSLVVTQKANCLSEDDLLLVEYAATVIGFELLRKQEVANQEAARKKLMVKIAFSTLSYSEISAIVNILKELDGDEGLLVASKIADRVGITRSVIVNALRKFESADIIETRSLGMKGTYIKIKNEFLFDELKR